MQELLGSIKGVFWLVSKGLVHGPYGIFTYICHKTYIWWIFMVNVGKDTIHGSYGIDTPLIFFDSVCVCWWGNGNQKRDDREVND